MQSFDREYASTTGMLYGEEPSLYLELLVRHYRVAPGPALDVGCGDGRNALYLARLGFEVTAVDVSEVAISKLLQNARNQHVCVDACVSDVTKFRYTADHYQLVVANTVLDHLDVNQGNGLAASLAKALRHGGHLFVTGFTTDDPGYSREATASSTAHYVKRYFRHGELRALFASLAVIRYHEEELLDSNHGLPHYHSIARLMARRIQCSSS